MDTMGKEKGNLMHPLFGVTSDDVFFLRVISKLPGGGLKYFSFSPLLGEMIQFDQYFSNGLQPPTSKLLRSVIYGVC